MPFEPYPVEKSLTQRLAAIDLVPVPQDFVGDYVRHVVKKDRTGGRWQETYLPNDRVIRSLKSPRILGRHGLGWWAAAPWRVRRLAARVQAHLPEAMFSLGYFRSDPYLQISVGRETAYLAVWRHRFALVAIATKTKQQN